MIRVIFAMFLVLVTCAFVPASAQELVEDTVSVMKARVTEIVSEDARSIPGTDTTTTYQSIRVTVLDGSEKGREVTVENDYLSLKVGDIFYLTHTENEVDGIDYYSVGEPYRIPALSFLAMLFVGITVFLGGRQGIRGLLSLALSFLLIVFVLLPLMIKGYSPIMISTLVASLIVLVGAYVTHGFSKMTTTAVLGMIATIVCTGALAHLAIVWTQLSGFSAEEATYLHLNSRGAIDLTGLLLGGILIGLLGVLYDAAIGQSVAVEELRMVGKNISRREIYLRALRIGREHIGALVNTLAIAYVGAALPLLLLFYGLPNLNVIEMINREIFAAEAVRILVGSIGVILVVPITTLIAVALLVKDKEVSVSDIGHTDRETRPSHGHTHRHSH